MEFGILRQLLENTSGFVCPACEATIDPFPVGGGEALAVETNTPFLGRIRFDPTVVEAGEAGVEPGPRIQTFFDDLAAKRIAEVAYEGTRT